jgi:hypothetical protein
MDSIHIYLQLQYFLTGKKNTKLWRNTQLIQIAYVAMGGAKLDMGLDIWDQTRLSLRFGPFLIPQTSSDIGL